MYIYQLISILALLLSCKCDGHKSHSKRSIAISAKSNDKPVEYRNEETLELLKSLLESKAIEQTLQRTENRHLQNRHLRNEESAKSEKDSQASDTPNTVKRNLLSDKITELTEDKISELAKSILISESKRTVRSTNDNRTLESTIMNGTGDITHEVTGISRLVSFGYNLIRGCPDGGFENGGIDSGIRTSHSIFKFTFHKGKNDSYFDSSYSQPDQVHFEPSLESLESSDNVYGGGKSYRDAITTGVSAAGNHISYQFSASETVASIHKKAMSSQSLFLDRKRTLTLGEVQYLPNDEDWQSDITDEFYDAVMNLPTTFFLTPEDKQKYFEFFDDWGTDVIKRAEVGLKHITRYRANYSSAFQFARSTCGNAIDAGEVGTGYVQMNIGKLNSMITPSAQFGNYETEMEFGTEQEPVPTRLYLEPITRALDKIFWTARFGDSQGNATATQLYNALFIKRQWLKFQLPAYAATVGSNLQDPDISIPIEWPQGTYALPQTTSGCPADFSSGCRTQDNEDTNNENQFSQNIDLALKGEFHNANENIQTCYCSKTEPGDSIFSWMPGRYCINRKGGSCPEGFTTGHIEWDDEDTNNINRNTGVLPDGQYPNGFTIINYCCRDDGATEDDILLPNAQPLVLYPYKENMCQEVHGMDFEQHFVYTDDEDSDNQGKCDGETPYVPNDCTGPDIKLTYCYYWSK